MGVPREGRPSDLGVHGADAVRADDVDAAFVFDDAARIGFAVVGDHERPGLALRMRQPREPRLLEGGARRPPPDRRAADRDEHRHREHPERRAPTKALRGAVVRETPTHAVAAPLTTVAPYRQAGLRTAIAFAGRTRRPPVKTWKRMSVREGTPGVQPVTPRAPPPGSDRSMRPRRPSARARPRGPSRGGCRGRRAVRGSRGSR